MSKKYEMEERERAKLLHPARRIHVPCDDAYMLRHYADILVALGNELAILARRPGLEAKDICTLAGDLVWNADKKIRQLKNPGAIGKGITFGRK